MSKSSNSRGQVLKSTAIVGGATVINLIVGLARTKVIALILGPTGIGLIGMWNATLSMGASVAGLGVYSSGVRQVAATAHDAPAAELSLRALWSLSILLSALGSGMFWLFRDHIALLTLGDSMYSSQVGWLSVGIGLSILGGAQMAAVQGYRRMGDFARLQLLSTVVAAFIGVAAVALFGEGAVLLVVLATPVTGCLFGYYYARKLPVRPQFASAGLKGVVPVWRTLTKIGIAITISAMLGSATQIVARTIIVRGLGLEAAGLFQAAWTVSAVNMGLLLAAMGADYYPRLSAVAGDQAAMNEQVNQQVHVALVLAGPVLLGVTSLAPIVLRLLYSEEFQGAAELLQWLTAADALRLTGWALGFVMLARQATVSYIMIEASFGIVFVPLMWALAPIIGLEAAGIAYFSGYLVCLILSVTLASKIHGVYVSRSNILWTSMLTVTLLAITASYKSAPLATAVAGTFVACVFSAYSLVQIERMGIRIPGISPIIDKLRSWAILNR
jgi:O-antigen/teichoic acid export membrane protein